VIIDTDEAKTWLRIDGNEEDALIGMLIGAAMEYLENATGRSVDTPPISNQARLFCLVLITDWYENRELIGTKPSEKVRYSLQSLLAQLTYCGDDT
jgi:uncharacterized phage protein (predicted DNA packaging)